MSSELLFAKHMQVPSSTIKLADIVQPLVPR